MPAHRMKLIKPSATLALTAKVAQLREHGENVVSFAAGEPDFDTPAAVKEAAVRAIAAGCTKYTATAGELPLREAIARKLAIDNGIQTDASQIVVSAGAKQAVFNSLMALCNPGDEVILIAPFWMTYRDQVTLCGAKPVIIYTSQQNGNVPSLQQIASAVTPNTKALIINSPCNPTGAVFPLSLLTQVAQMAVERNFYVISDEIYEKHVYGDAKHFSIASFGAEIAQRTITVGGVSKAYAMTGWRLGYTSSPVELASAMATIQDQVTSNASSISQRAALEALASGDAEVKQMVHEFACRRTLILEELSKIEKVQFSVPVGAFYVFVDVSEFLKAPMNTDAALAQYLLEEHKVACVPGSVFEGPGHLRLTYALDRPTIVEGVRRISEGLQSLTSNL